MVDKTLLVRRMYVVAGRVLDEAAAPQPQVSGQLDLFTDYAAEESRRQSEEDGLAREHRMQQAMLAIKKRYGKNAILKGMNYQDGATARQRNGQIGGHKA